VIHFCVYYRHTCKDIAGKNFLFSEIHTEKKAALLSFSLFFSPSSLSMKTYTIHRTKAAGLLYIKKFLPLFRTIPGRFAVHRAITHLQSTSRHLSPVTVIRMEATRSHCNCFCCGQEPRIGPKNCTSIQNFMLCCLVRTIAHLVGR
jgi:hypothetical protein